MLEKFKLGEHLFKMQTHTKLWACVLKDIKQFVNGLIQKKGPLEVAKLRSRKHQFILHLEDVKSMVKTIP